MSIKGRKNTDHALRDRIHGWLVYYLEQFKQAGQTQADLAARLGIAAPSLSQYLGRKREVGLDTLARMHRGLRVSADTLLDLDAPKARPPRVPRPRLAPANASSETGPA